VRRVTYIQQLTPAPGLHLHGSGDKKRRSPASRPYELGAFTGVTYLSVCKLADFSRVQVKPGFASVPGFFLWRTGSRRRNCTSSVRRFGKIANITPMMMLECWVIVGVTLLKGVEFDTKIFIVFSKPGFWPRLFFLSSGAVIASTRRIPPSGQAGWTTSHAGLPSYSPGFLVCGLSEHAVHRRLWCFGTGGVTNSLRSAMSLRRLNC